MKYDKDCWIGDGVDKGIEGDVGIGFIGRNTNVFVAHSVLSRKHVALVHMSMATRIRR